MARIGDRYEIDQPLPMVTRLTSFVVAADEDTENDTLLLAPVGDCGRQHHVVAVQIDTTMGGATYGVGTVHELDVIIERLIEVRDFVLELDEETNGGPATSC